MSLVDDTCDNCGGRFDPMGDPLLTKHPEIGPYAVFCATCETSVPPTQPPAAPETDVRLTDAEDVLLADWWVSEGGDHEDLALDSLTTVVERIVAERVRVVESERDAALDDRDAAAASWESACDRADLWIARAESAEAAHAALVAAVEALADEWEADFMAYRHEDPAHLRIRALLAREG